MVALPLAAIEMGVENDTPVVFLHGFGGVAAVWEPVQREIAADHFTIAFDLPSHGGSLSRNDAKSANGFAKAVLHDLDQRGINRVHLVGHSMGGATAALMAIAAPDRVASLTLLAPGGMGPQINAALITRYAAARDRVEISACLADMMSTGIDDDGLVSVLAAARAQPGQTDVLQQIASRMLRDGQQGEIDRLLLAALTMPVKVLWGIEDRMVPVEQARDFPVGFDVRILPGAAHMLVEEKPQEVLAAIRENIASTLA